MLSLTELFKDITTASMQMLGYTAVAIVVLSVVSSLAITYIVVSPLKQLSNDMENVSNMELEHLGEEKRSRFYEISVMQEFFLNMVQKLMVLGLLVLVSNVTVSRMAGVPCTRGNRTT